MIRNDGQALWQAGSLSEAEAVENIHDAYLVLDLAPHVMSRVRDILRGQKTSWSGRYTHAPMALRINMSNAKDVLWIAQRYELMFARGLKEHLLELCERHDRIRSEMDVAASDGSVRFSDRSLPMAIPLRPHQLEFVNAHSKAKRMLLADTMGLGKTASAIGTLVEPEARPALVVAPAHLCTQWERELKRFVPDLKTHVIRGFKNYDLPDVDVVITSYNRLAPWEDKLLARKGQFSTVVFDEVHDLRHIGTGKRQVAAALSLAANRVVGLSGTPIYNYGGEIWSVMDVINPGCLDDQDTFLSEWCTWGRVSEPILLHSFLRSEHLFMRRTPKEVGLPFGSVSKSTITLDSDIEALKALEDVTRQLAMSVLSGNVVEMSEAGREFDWRMRQATGVAKARSAAEFVKMLCADGEKVVLAGWHREVYDIWQKELKALNPVPYTGTESPAQKDAAVKRFVEGDSQVFIISLRSGAGLDGLQHASRTVVFGELDWSPHVMDQVVSRLDRDGQKDQVNAYYLTVPDGADPVMLSVLSEKRSQHEGLVEGSEAAVQILESDADRSERIRRMARAHLESLGEDIPEPVSEDGLLADVAEALRRVRVTSNSEAEMQRGLWQVLPKLLDHAKVEREVPISQRSRLDFLVSEGEERVAIECKVEQGDRSAVYRQVRRYVEEAKVTGVVIYAPWNGISSFVVDETPVLVVDPSRLSV